MTSPSTAPATQATVVETPPAPPANELDLVRLDDPAYPTGKFLDLPAPLNDAAKIVLKRPAYIDPAGNLWLTHPAGRPIAEVLKSLPIKDKTAVVRETVRYVHWPTDGGTPHAVLAGDTVADDTDFARAVAITGGLVVPTRTGVVFYSDDFKTERRHDLPRVENSPDALPSPVIARSGDGVWAWSPWENGKIGSRGPMFIDANGSKTPEPSAGWPETLIEITPLADGSVLTISQGESAPVVKLIAAPEQPPTADMLRAIKPLAQQLADRDPVKRREAQRALEAQGPAAFPVLEALREQLPPEAQVRIETLLGNRFAPSLGGLRPLDGACHVIARFPRGGCLLKLDGGGSIDAEDDEPARTVIPAFVLIRPGHFVEWRDSDAFGDFVPGRNAVQWVNGELLIGDPKLGPRRQVGLTLKPLLPPAFAAFDTVQGIDARSRWLLTNSTKKGESLLIDPSLPDTTPKLPIYTVAARDGAGRTAAGWPAVKRGDRLFVLDARGWHVDKPEAMLPPPPNLPAVFDRDGTSATITDGGIELTDRDGGTTRVDLKDADDPQFAMSPKRLWVYTPDGKVNRYARSPGPTVKWEATFTQRVPSEATSIWLDPAGRLIMLSDSTLAISFTDGRLPSTLNDLMLNVDR
ncbi:MAG: hypothetical protein QM754_19410 [Tepidisphaeraceae bacterium]